MTRGRVERIWVAPAEGAHVRAVDEVVAHAGVGLEGDRYFSETNRADPARQLTLIEAEALDAANADCGIDLRDGRHRRNVVVRGVALNDLVGREFTVGDVTVRGVELCHPCRSMEQSAGAPGAVKALVNRGGLNAEILMSGSIRVGDAVVTP
jgi:MOSC domain-containing protein YiiM